MSEPSLRDTAMIAAEAADPDCPFTDGAREDAYRHGWGRGRDAGVDAALRVVSDQLAGLAEHPRLTHMDDATLRGASFMLDEALALITPPTKPGNQTPN